MHCDVRLLVAVSDDVDKPLIDPYAVPEPCRCTMQDLPRRRRLDLHCDFGHKCCFVTAKLFPFKRKNCKQAVLFHEYKRRGISREALFARGPATEDEGWAPLPSIDADIYGLRYAPSATSEFRSTRGRFLEESRGLYEVLRSIKKTEAAVQQKSAHLQGKQHESCLFLEKNWEWVCGYPSAKNWECSAREDLEMLTRETDILEEVAKEFRDRLVDAFFAMVQLEEEGEGEITGLSSWG
jgi:hypothetical protein